MDSSAMAIVELWCDGSVNRGPTFNLGGSYRPLTYFPSQTKAKAIHCTNNANKQL